MKRVLIAPRANLSQRITEYGFEYASSQGEPYWDERAYYGLTLRQIEDDLEDPSAELSALCLAFVDLAVRDEHVLKRLDIPPFAWDLIAESWRRRDPSLYGRFDLAYDGNGPAKLLEYNADTPTALFEAAVFQWVWLEDMIAAGRLPPSSDQFNSIHEALLAAFSSLKRAVASPSLHLAALMESTEDRGLIAYLADIATQAGYAVNLLSMSSIGSRGKGPFVGLRDEPIGLLFKLYPWEWMWHDAFARSLSMRATQFLEPPWKAILSNKGILPYLWEMAPGHPNLLPCWFEGDPGCSALSGNFARKPLHAREGQNVTLHREGQQVAAASGPSLNGPCVLQALAPLPCCAGNYPVVGSWIVGGKPCGIGFREDRSPITQNTSRFIPHAIID